MATNILSLPLLTVTFRTGTNESWRDSVAFVTAGSITAFPTIGNIGNGTVTFLTVMPGAYIGDYALTMTSATQFRLTDPDGYLIGAGVVNVPFMASGINFTLAPGTSLFAAGDTYTLNVLPQALDITGIRFVMQMRAATPSAQILVSADTNDGSLVNGGMSGVLGLAVLAPVMATVPVSPDGSPHVLDILAIADGDQRRCVTGTCAVVPGYTFPAS